VVAEGRVVVQHEHRAVHQQVAAGRKVARHKGVQVACSIRIRATVDAVIAVLSAAGDNDGAGGVVSEVASVVAVEDGVDSLARFPGIDIHTCAAFEVVVAFATLQDVIPAHAVEAVCLVAAGECVALCGTELDLFDVVKLRIGITQYSCRVVPLIYLRRSISRKNCAHAGRLVQINHFFAALLCPCGVVPYVCAAHRDGGVAGVGLELGEYKRGAVGQVLIREFASVGGRVVKFERAVAVNCGVEVVAGGIKHEGVACIQGIAGGKVGSGGCAQTRRTASLGQSEQGEAVLRMQRIGWVEV